MHFTPQNNIFLYVNNLRKMATFSILYNNGHMVGYVGTWGPGTFTHYIIIHIEDIVI